MFKYFLFFLLIIHNKSFAEKEIIKNMNGIELKSSKEKNKRIYQGSITKILPYSADAIKMGIINYPERCNNEYIKKRMFSSSSTSCKYHSENLIETIIIRDLIKNENIKQFSDAFVLGRRIHNRGTFGYYELVTIQEKETSKGKNIVIINRMLGDNETNQYITPKFKRESAFDESSETFIVNEISPNQTELNYTYLSTTAHWLLNKEVTVTQVFSSMEKSISRLLNSIEQESKIQSKETVPNK